MGKVLEKVTKKNNDTEYKKNILSYLVSVTI